MNNIYEVLNYIKTEDNLIPNGKKPLIHQWTLNGYTYPFVLENLVAALPHPKPSPVEIGFLEYKGKYRRHSLLSHALLVKPGDLIFFFKADPNPKGDYRGIVGIFQAVSEVYSSEDALILYNPQDYNLPVQEKPYKIYGICPIEKCLQPYSSLKKCINDHEILLNGDCPEYIFNLRLNLKPLLVFKYAIPDETVYADFRSFDPCSDVLIWTGRHDNAMGAGKGSSTRILLPEEALRISTLFTKVPNQEILRLRNIHHKHTSLNIKNPDGTSINEFVFIKNNNEYIAGEHDMITTAISLDIRNKNSILLQIFKQYIKKYTSSSFYLEYVSPEYPLGYTGTEVDYLVSFKETNKRIRYLFLIEIKKTTKEIQRGILQLWFYIYWVVQLFSGCWNRNCLIDNIHIIPVLISPFYISNLPRNILVPSIVKNPTSIQLIAKENINIFIHDYIFLQYFPKIRLKKNLFRSPIEFLDVTSVIFKHLQKRKAKLPVGMPLRHIEKLGINSLKHLIFS